MKYCESVFTFKMLDSLGRKEKRETLICSLNTWLIQKAGHSERIFSASCAFIPPPPPLPSLLPVTPLGFLWGGGACLT